MMISPDIFSFLLNLDSWAVRWVKGQEMAQNDKRLCLSHSVSQEPYIYHMIVILGTHV